MTFRANKLPPPPKTTDPQEWHRWFYRVHELLNGIVTILGTSVEVTPGTLITGTDVQEAVTQVDGYIVGLRGNLATTVVSEEAFGQSDAVGTSTVFARQDHTHGTPTDPVPAHVAEADPHVQYQKESEKGQANGYASLDVGGTVPDAQIHAAITRDAEAAAAYAPIAKGVTNGDSHDHAGGDGAQIDHTGLSNIGTNTHAQIDTHIAAATGHSGVYGSCYGNEIGWTQAAAVQNTWYEVSDADMADGALAGVTHDGNGKLTVGSAGKYLVVYSVVVESSAINKHIMSLISVSGTEQDAGRCHFELITANAQVPMCGTAVLTLDANATVEVSVGTTDTGTPDLAVDHLNISVVKVGT